MARRIVALVTDAFGGRGGIAAYNRNLLQAACRYSGIDEVVALPRSVVYELEPMPANLRFETGSAGSNVRDAGAGAGAAPRPSHPGPGALGPRPPTPCSPSL